MSSRIRPSLRAWAARLVNQTQRTQYLLKSDFRLSNFFLSSWDMKPAGMKGEGCKPSSAPRTLRPGTLERPLVVKPPLPEDRGGGSGPAGPRALPARPRTRTRVGLWAAHLRPPRAPWWGTA